MLAVVQKVDAAEAEALAALRERATRDAERRRAARRALAARKPTMARQARNRLVHLEARLASMPRAK